jgi:molecular chaperone GrpE
MTVESREEPREEPPKEAAAPEAPAVVPPAEDWATRYKYLLADFENYRRRSERERETITRQSRAGMLRELLPILEAFRTARDALNHLPATDPVRRGLEILDREWMTFLKHEGVEPVATVGHPFRADEAEAVGHTSADEHHPDGTVAEIVQQGYRFFGGLLRPAKVVVARTSSAAPSTPAGPTGEKTAEEP